MDSSNAFLAFYGTQVQELVRLPEKITSRYLAAACLSSTENKEVCLLQSRTSDDAFIVRRLPLDRAEMNRTEFELLRGLDHPRIPKAAELFEEDGFSYLTRTYIRGVTLQHYVDRNGPVPEHQAVSVLIQLCDILTYLHTRTPPVIHRDIKPQNVVVSPGGDIYLIDFDISRKYNPAAAKDTVFAGTVATAPPEQYGYIQTDARSDIYSLGILAIFLCTGRYELRAVGALPRRLRRVAVTCTEFSPKDRYASAAQLKTRLARARFAGPLRLAAVSAAALCLIGALYLTHAFPSPGLKSTASASPAASPVQTAFVSPAPSSAAPSAAPSSAAGEPYVFTSRPMADLVRYKLGKPLSEAVTAGDMLSFRELRAAGVPEKNYTWQTLILHPDELGYVDGAPVARGDISSLDDLAAMQHLTSVSLVYQKINDLSPLAGLPLRDVMLIGNNIGDLTPLAGMPTLTGINLNHNPVSDLTPLVSLPKLTGLCVQYTDIRDISVLAQMPTLQIVQVGGAPVADYTPLLSLPRLTQVEMSGAGVKDVAMISGIEGLKEFIVQNCGISSLSALKTLPRLETLWLNDNVLTDLDGIERFSAVKTLMLCGNPIRDLSPLQGLPNLQLLDLRDTNAELSPLLRIPSLRKIICSPEMQPLADRIGDSARFAIEFSSQ